MASRILVVAPAGPEGATVCDLLRGTRPHWEVLTAASTSSALAVCGVLDVDVVVVSDALPDAPLLVARLAETQPSVGRVAVVGTGVGSGDFSAAHQQLSRPPAGYPLVRAVGAARAAAAATRVDPVERVVAGIDVLPAAPLVWTRLRSLLADPGSDVGEIVRVIGQDASSTATVLRLANGSGLRGPGAVADLGDAVRLLGLRTVTSALLAPQVLSALRQVRPVAGLRVHELSRHGWACGLVAQELVENPALREHAFVAGLLQDVGQLALALRSPTAYRTCLADAVRRRRPLHLVERDEMGLDHAQVGAALLERWRLPAEVVAGVGGSHTPLTGSTGSAAAGDRPAADVAFAVRLAHCLVSSRWLPWSDPHEPGAGRALAQESEDALAALRLDGRDGADPLQAVAGRLSAQPAPAPWTDVPVLVPDVSARPAGPVPPQEEGSRRGRLVSRARGSRG